ncbi:MAG: nitroreductase family protein [Candidatus Brocadiae bacterium]|nr:nitroreductase family protein [Candidatus Brocadiia bacterium]
MDFYEVIRQRRSIRAYRSDPVEEDRLLRVLDAARVAPSAANRQPVHFTVIRDDALRAKMVEVYSQQWFVQAPVIICACARPSEAWQRSDGKNYADVDLTIAMDHLILAATAEGLGTCWIGAFKQDKLRKLLDLPPELEPVALTPLGYPAEKPDARPRKPLDDMVEHR